MSSTTITILGAGPAGLGAALGLARAGHDVTVLEQADRVGGNAGSFELGGLRVDYGSHRFHPAADPGVFALVRELLGDDLLERPRHGRIRLLGRWIHFPLRPLDLALRAHPRFTAGVIGDLVRTAVGLRAEASGPDTFASVLERGLGRTICREFYFPYARKIWGLAPEEISPTQARRRVSAGSIGKLVKRLIPGAGGPGARGSRGVFFYPRHGYGQISERLQTAAEAAGARIRLGTAATRAELTTGPQGPVIATTTASRTDPYVSHHLWSTIPLNTLVRLTSPSAPPDVLDAARRLELRAMLLVYLVLDSDQFTEFDAHYFPEEALPFTRVSEPKNYSDRREPSGRTVLCAEIPCGRGDALWSSPDDDLAAIVRDGLGRAGLPVRCAVREVAVRRLPAAYPIYRAGYEDAFGQVDRWVSGLEGVLSFGRQGLYAHDNTHHALYMAGAAVDCLRTGEFDQDAWRRHRRVFETHVVED